MKLKNHHIISYILGILVLGHSIISCFKNDSVEITTIENKFHPAKSTVILLDSMSKPEISPPLQRDIVKLGNPSEFATKDNKIKVKPIVVKAGIPLIFSAGNDSTSAFQEVKAIHNSKLAKAPNINQAKEPFSPDYNPYNLLFYTLKEGLIESQIHNMFQDKKGNLWTGSFNGVSKFNGHTFENFSKKEGLVDEFFECGLEDHEGNIWLGFRDGVSKYDGKHFTNYTTKEGLSNNNVVSMIEDNKGNIWFGTHGGGATMLSNDRKTFKHFNFKNGLSPIILCMKQDKDGNIWFGTQLHGLFKFDGKNFYNYSTPQGLTFVTINDIEIDQNNNLWISTWTGISKFDGTDFYHIKGLLNGYANKITIDHNQNVWFGGAPGGIYKLDKNGSEISFISQSDGLNNTQAWVTLEDQKGNMWFGTDNGLIKHTKLAQNINEKNGLAGLEVSTVLKDNEQNIWVGTYEGGISKIDLKKNKILNYTHKQGLRNGDITSMLQDREGNIWVGTQFNELFRLNPKNNTLEYFLNSGTYIVCIFEDKAGDIWYSSREKGEVRRIRKNDSKVIHYSPKQGLPQDKVVRIWQDSNENMWFCTFNGVSKLNKDHTLLSNYTEKEGFKFGVVESIIEDKHGNFWFSTLSNGITYLNPKKNSFLNLTEKDGLSNNTSFGILYDKKGNFWFNTRLGLSFLSSDVVDQLAGNKPFSKPILFKNYQQEQGYLGFGAGRFDIIEDSSGKIWLPMLDRLTIFNPKEERKVNAAPSVEINKVKLYNEEIEWKNDTTYMLKNGLKIKDFKFERLSNWYGLPTQLTLPFDLNFISFEYVGIDISTPSKVIYQHFLEGFDKRWSIASNRKEAVYGNLPPGKYTFKVRSKIGESNWSPENSYEFTINPPFWKTWWAYLIYSILILGLFFWFIQYRIERGLKRIRSLESIRTKISSDLHDDVGSILSGLAMQSQMLAYHAKDQLKENLLELSQMSQDAMERMRETVWAIDSRKDKYENLIDKMREYAERNFHLKDIKHTFSTELVDSKKFINPEKRQNIYLIFKEAITNICKHSNATQVNISIKQYNSHFILIIKDNGTLFNLEKSEGSGLKNMKMRAKNIGYELNTKFNDGYCVTLRKS